MTPTAIAPELDATDRKLLHTLGVTGTISLSGLAEFFGTDALQRLRALEHLGLLYRPYGPQSNALAITDQGRLLA